MKKLLVACAVALLLTVGAWVLTTRGSGVDGESAVHPGAQETVRRDAGRRALVPRGADEGKEEPAAPVVGAAAAGAPVETGPARIAGRVIDERTGAGAAGAEVFVLSNEISREDLAAATPRTTADSDGRFVCEDLAVGPHHVAARAPGVLVAHAHDVDAAVTGGTDVELLLRRPRSITGRIVVPSAVSLHGATVSARTPNDRAPAWNWWTYVGRDGDVAPDGTFTIGGLPPGEFDVHAGLRDGARRFAVSAYAVASDGPAVVLTLDESEDPVHRYRLRVLDPSGRPVAWAEARRCLLNWGGATMAGTEELRDGVAEVDLSDCVQCVWYEVFRYRDGSGRVVAAAPRGVRLAPPDDLEKTVRLEPAVSLTGRVRDAVGGGVPGVKVAAEPAVWAMDEWPRNRQVLPHGEATTDADGAFRFDELAPIEYRIAVDVPPRFVTPPDVSARPGDIVDVALRAARQPVVTVLDAASLPVEGVAIALFAGEDEPGFSARTGADGRARLDRIEPGRKFRLTLDANDDRFAKLAVPDWDPIDATFRLPSALTLRGTVVSRDGTPVPGAHVFVRHADGDRRYAEADEDGGFLVDRLAPGDVPLAVSFVREGPEPDAPRFTAKAGDQSVVLAIDAGLVLHATIDNWGDRDDSLVRNSPRFVEDGPAPAKVHFGLQTSNRLAFAGLPPDRTGTILFGPLEGGFRVLRTGVRTDAGKVTVSLDRGATFSGRVVLPEGVPPDAVQPEVRIEVFGIDLGCNTRRTGHWSAEGIPDGTWPVRATLRFGGKTYTATTTASPGVSADLELRETR